jgi:D-glycero-alpha-D-manno-heptose-7-phosphate kinase
VAAARASGAAGAHTAARRLSARAPTRLDFGGGWTDVPPYPVESGGFVCNVAIARHARATILARDEDAGGASAAEEGDALARAALRRASLHGVALRLTSDFPRGAGLGGSSAAGVAALAAIDGWRRTSRPPAALAEASRVVEVEELGIAGGRQDHYAAAFGGALALRFGERVDVERLPLAGALSRELERRCLVLYTGESRISGETISAVLDAYRVRVPRVVEALARMKRLAEEMADALRAADVDALGALVGEHWTHQRALHPGITTARIEAIMERAAGHGALGAKALGASGGGCVLVVAPADGVAALAEALAGLGERLPFTVDHDGVRVDADA